jgi:hypothetical protein
MKAYLTAKLLKSNEVISKVGVMTIEKKEELSDFFRNYRNIGYVSTNSKDIMVYQDSNNDLFVYDNDQIIYKLTEEQKNLVNKFNL